MTHYFCFWIKYGTGLQPFAAPMNWLIVCMQLWLNLTNSRWNLKRGGMIAFQYSVHLALKFAIYYSRLVNVLELGYG